MSCKTCGQKTIKIAVQEPIGVDSPRPELVYGLFDEKKPHGIFRRFFSTLLQLLALLIGGGFAYVREERQKGKGRSLRIILLRIMLAFTWLFMNKELISLPFPIQFRRRLEAMGPSYIKLGQILSLREDILPKNITEELKNLLRQAPVVPFQRFLELIEADLKKPTNEMFDWINPLPLGSGSLAQTHLARLKTNEDVVIKALKPGVRKMVETDTKLLKFFGWVLNIFLSRYQPGQLTAEFSRYSLREVDMRIEADNAEIFAANFKDIQKIRFPRIYRDFSNREVLTMEYMRGHEVDDPAVKSLPESDKSQIIDLGIRAIIQMIFRDGFFHADLHPANIIVLPEGRIGFIDLGMIGQFDGNLRTLMFYYFYSLMEGNAAAAARYLTSLAWANRKSNVDGFRRAVEDLNRRWLRHPSFEEFSLGQLILESFKLAGHYRIRYPGEVILMVKAMVTVEGVGNQLIPGINIVTVSKKHIKRMLWEEFNPVKIVRNSILLVPEILDTLKQSPLYINDFKKILEWQVARDEPNIITGLLGTIFGSVCLLTGAILAVFGQPIWLWGFFFISGFSIAGFDLINRKTL